ncbi:MAG: hypothetical protein KGM98_12275, partial [Bacteroidota bacterium]|nr:hypothetical protein [Bacteroidota bacterium]
NKKIKIKKGRGHFNFITEFFLPELICKLTKAFLEDAMKFKRILEIGGESYPWKVKFFEWKYITLLGSAMQRFSYSCTIGNLTITV